jgi:integrase
MRGHVRRRGATWSYVVDAGMNRARRCTTCDARVWTEWGHSPGVCPKCAAELGEERQERQQIWKSGFRTKRAAEQEMRDFLVKVGAGADPLPKDLTVTAWVEKWLVSERVRSLRTQTSNRYRQLLRNDVIPSIGGMQLVDVRPRHIALVLERLAERGMSARTITQCRAVMSSCFRAALEAELLQANPVAATRPPKTARPDLKVPDAEQLAALIAGAVGTPWEVPILLSCMTGMRRSEVLAVRWSGTDLVAGRLGVEAGLHRDRDDDGSRLAFHANKTDRSRRSISLPAVAVARLRQHKTEQLERRLRLGAGWQDMDLVCERGDGAPLDPDAFSLAFKRLAKSAGLPDGVRLHDVRHAVATVLLERGVHPAITSAMLGHASPSFTMATYQHVTDNMTAKAAAELDAALSE